MALFDKCTEFNRRVNYLKTLNQFFYLRETNPAATPVVITKAGNRLIQLASNNYLGLSYHPKVVEAVTKAIEEYGTGSCSSRVLAGTTSLHVELERRLASFKGTEDAVVFSTGYMTMMGTISAITGEGDIILSDQLNHASIIDGCRLSRAEVKIYQHNNMTSLEEKLASCDLSANKLIVTDGVFSMKGTVANLPEIKKLADRYNACIMVDDAHGTGVLGTKGHGILEYYNMEGEIDLICGTFSKSLATIGGFTGATKEIVTFLRLNSRPFVFTASPPAPVVATALAALTVIEEEPELLRKLHKNADFLKRELIEAGFTLEETITPIIPILIGNDEKVFKMAGQLEEEGVMVNPVVPPAVPEESSLIRVSVMASLSMDELAEAISKFKIVGKRLGVI